MPTPASAATAELCPPQLPAIRNSAMAALRYLIGVPSHWSDKRVIAEVRGYRRTVGKQNAIHHLLDVLDNTEDLIRRVPAMRTLLFSGDVDFPGDYPDDYEAKAYDCYVRNSGRRKLDDLDAEDDL